MTYNLYAYRDNKIGFLRPFPAENDAVAVREFTDSINRPEFRYRDDFELFKLGVYDSQSGIITVDKKCPVFLVSATSVPRGDDNGSK